ncbi:hypothetical protein [Streptomyces sp. NPDC046759]|uniref:hypothetical protein n=1 Tax=Streptomyces sp. NPDC046759 TaxID=3155019 RepID=UPI0033EC99B5
MSAAVLPLAALFAHHLLGHNIGGTHESERTRRARLGTAHSTRPPAPGDRTTTVAAVVRSPGRYRTGTGRGAGA